MPKRRERPRGRLYVSCVTKDIELLGGCPRVFAATITIVAACPKAQFQGGTGVTRITAAQPAWMIACGTIEIIAWRHKSDYG